MFPVLMLAAVLDSAAVPAPPDSERTRPRAVVRLEQIVIEGVAIHDPLSSETVHRISSRSLRTTPVDRLRDLVALRAGVVARGEVLHVRGGRAGELVTQLQGVTLEEPLRGRAAEVPLIAIREAELVSGGPDAEYGGALGGVLVIRTVEPGERWGGELQWRTDGRLGTHYDQVAARLGGPIPATGLGVVGSLEAELDDTALPSLRTPSRRRLLGGSFGWRADNRVRGHFKLTGRNPASRLALETLISRRVDRPYDPMWSLDGWVTRCSDPSNFCFSGPAYSATPLPGYSRYIAADHHNITDDRRATTLATWLHSDARAHAIATLSWSHARTVNSIDGHEREPEIDRYPEFGIEDTTLNDPFHIYAGDEPYYRTSTTDVFGARVSYQRSIPRGGTFETGAAATLDRVSLRELDLTTYGAPGESLRTYRATAPGGFAFGQFRWIAEGLVVNGGLRAEYFTAGKDAKHPVTGQPVPGVWSLSPRLGLSYPVSVRDVFSLSYVRVRQNPGRDFLYDNRTLTTNVRPLRNGALQPATLISYQAALKHLLPRGWWVQAGWFYRDVFGLIGARNFRPPPFEPVLRYENADDAHASGLELTIASGESGAGRVELDYTYLHARGTDSREEGIPFGPLRRARPESIEQSALDWDRRHSIALSATWQKPSWSVAWSTAAGSGLPWTPRDRRQFDADRSRENTRRLGWDESSAVALRWNPPHLARRLTVGLDVRNVFDHRGDIAVTVDGYPNAFINTVYDDYGAYRNETGKGGGAYWNDNDGDGVPGWVEVHDPRLISPPRAFRLMVGTSW